LNHSRKVIFSILAIALLGSVSLAYAFTYEFTLKFGSSGTTGEQFGNIGGMAVNSTHIIVADSNLNRVQIFDSSGNFAATFGFDVTTGGGTGFEICTVSANCKTGISGSSDGQFSGLTAVAVNSTHIITTEGGNDRVQIFDLSGNFAAKFGTSGGGNGQFNNPVGIAVNSTRIIVSDRINDDVQIFDLSGNFLDTFGSSGTTGGLFIRPTDIALDSNDRIIVADASRIQIFTPSGDFVSMFGFDVITGGGTGFEICTVSANCKAGTSGTGDGQFSGVEGVGIDSNDNIIATDSSFLTSDRVQIFDSSGNFVSMFGFGVDDGTAVFQTCKSGCQAGIPGSGDGQFDLITELVVDSNDRIITAEGSNARVQIFTPLIAFLSDSVSVTDNLTTSAAILQTGYQIYQTLLQMLHQM